MEIALIAVAGGMVAVRAGWAGRRWVAVAGWAVALVGVAALMRLAGAWGIAVGTMTGMATALALVLVAAWRSPLRPARPARTPRRVAGSVGARDVARRVAVFVLVVPVAAAAAEALAIGAQRAAQHHGAVAADATVLGWFVQPAAWMLIAVAQVTRPGIAAMIWAPAATGIAGAVLLAAA